MRCRGNVNLCSTLLQLLDTLSPVNNVFANKANIRRGWEGLQCECLHNDKVFHRGDIKAIHEMLHLQWNCETLKGDTSKQHIHHHEPHLYAASEDDLRKVCVENLKRNFQEQTSVMDTFAKTTNVCSEASFRVAHCLGIAEKLYSDGKLVKVCI